MEPTPEVQTEGQLPDQAEVDKMTAQEISDRIDSDLEFSVAITDGRLTIPDGVAPADAGGAEGSGTQPAETPAEAPVETPAETPAPAAEPPKEEALIDVKIKQSDLGNYKSVAELLKGKREADGAISLRDQQLQALESQLNSQNSYVTDLAKKLKDAEEKLKKEKEHAPKPADAPAAGEEDLYDPESLKRIKAKADRVDQVESDLKEMKEMVANTTKQLERLSNKDAVVSQFKDLADFQKRVPELSTEKSLADINEEYKRFLGQIGTLAGGNGTRESQLQAAQIFLSDSTERGEKLRKAAEVAGVKIPEDYDKYSALIHLRNMRATHFRRNGEREEPLSLDELYQMSGMRANFQGADAPAQSAQPKPPALKPGQGMEAALAERAAAAATVPAGEAGGGPEDLSAKEQMEIMDTPLAELRTNPAKLKLYNAIMVQQGQEPLDPFQTS